MTGPIDYVAPAACARNRFTPLQRFAILFGVSLGVKYVLRVTSLAPSAQALLLAGVASVLVWKLWSAGAANRRSMIGLTALLWLVTVVKILRG